MLGRVSNCSVAVQKSQPAQRELESKDCLVEGFHIDQKWTGPGTSTGLINWLKTAS